ncbi:MAG: aspartate aminotransferase family protein [Erysipelotrichaceae bacterium]|uniref:aspartate aminotransferase family protein n=1 Tax=Floccifex sp. TaxID=2815810 RepID=UPI002A74ECAF|nr:aspartate aminotransferase family protein [Floccifex sp.]MDD7280675.1 aspartate aminotransferase family protein [Erysipelotrichaceae bacterium]MDY2957402.1 aspartate aminotransferase family protein [Floccifex sp.]
MNLEIKEKENQYVMSTYGRFDICFKKGNGCVLVDDENHSYLDCTSGIGVNSLGHNHPEVVKVIQEQAQNLLHVSNLYYSEPMIYLAEKLVTASHMNKVFFANSGAEANEGMIKIARKYSYDKYGENRNVILTLKQSFHGRTMATLSATGQDKFHHYFYPFVDGFDYVECNNIHDLENKCDDKVCGIMMELIQGESGVVPLNVEYVQQVEKLCHEKDILLMIDEVQTGIGRTGTLFAFEQYQIHPDLVSLAKGLGAGMPIGAVLTAEKCQNTLQKGEHGTTFGGNLMSCAVANKVMEIVNQPDFLYEVEQKGNYFMNQIKAISSSDIKEVRGKGLMIGIVVDEKKRMDYVNEFIKKGLLVLTAGIDVIRLLPPLIISYEEIDKIILIMQEVFQ